MKRYLLLSIISLLSVSLTAPGQDNSQHHTIVPLMQSGKLVEVVSGNPGKAGVPYVIRIGNPKGFVVLPHTHPEDEHIAVIKGTWYLGSGEKFDRAALKGMTVGDYALVPKGMAHFGWAEDDIIIQVHGIGPFRVDFVDPIKLLGATDTEAYFKFKRGDGVTSKDGDGIIARGMCSPANKITQYEVQQNNGQSFVALEAELQERK
jgi:quercetin dioxygenase-like cupin family protein